MIDIVQIQALREMLKKKFKGKKYVKSRVSVHYKENLEREYKRVIDSYYDALFEAIQPIIKFINDSPIDSQPSQKGFRYDDRKTDFLNFIRNAFKRTKDVWGSKSDAFELKKKVDKVGGMTRKLSMREWHRVVSKSLGINILDDVYSGDFYREQLDLWAEQNASMIKSLPSDVLDEMQQIVEESFLNGETNREIAKKIQDRFNVSRNKARFYAVDQLAKLNAAIAKQQQTECGVEEYIWSTSRDQRVRDSHKKLDGKKFSWNDPPIVDAKTGRRAHPGEDYRCRCVAIPVFNLETVTFPVMEGNNPSQGGKQQQ